VGKGNDAWGLPVSATQIRFRVSINDGPDASRIAAASILRNQICAVPAELGFAVHTDAVSCMSGR
jgi:hypothetical protein